MTAPAPISWIPLKALGARFTANLMALGGRMPELADALSRFTPKQDYYLLSANENIQIGTRSGSAVTPLAHWVPAATATEIIRKLYPAAVCHHACLISGEDLGWLWNGIYQLPCQAPGLPGHRPPLFFLIREIERLWMMLHIHDWRKLLADERVRLFVGSDALAQVRRSLLSNRLVPWPRLSVQVDQALWNGKPTLDEILAEAKRSADAEFHSCLAELGKRYDGATPQSIGAVLSSGRELKILGITSRFTTFLQYSMRDWLAGFEQLGHKTRLIIEDRDHEVGTNLNIARTCAEFQPDLVVIIDHYRRELGGMPENVPVVMWVQDALPNIYRREAGSAQGPLDYTLGFGRLELVHEFGYPASRFMSAVIGCDPRRFEPGPLSEADQGDYACDVSFVSHASTPAEVLLQQEIARAGTPEAERLLREIFEQVRGIYEEGATLTEPSHLWRIIETSMAATKTAIPASEMPKLMEMFLQRINNALFRHQSLAWLAALGVDLRLYGRGWEKHPTLSRFARGVADNNVQLAKIYRASRISIHVSPFGAVHQRVMEGLAGGGFFLLRHCPGDVLERHYRTIWNYCRSRCLETDAQLRGCDEPAIAEAIGECRRILQLDPFAMKHAFIEELRNSAEGGFTRSAGTIWGSGYDAVAFNSAAELAEKVKIYLTDESLRRKVGAEMRQAVLDRFTYAATSRRVLEFIAGDLATRQRQKAAA
jgi:hypothetical protein